MTSLQVSIPQAVSTVATESKSLDPVEVGPVSIPQAVSTVATTSKQVVRASTYHSSSFNTASGKHCCNDVYGERGESTVEVSIPQAVSTVATFKNFESDYKKELKFQYRKR